MLGALASGLISAGISFFGGSSARKDAKRQAREQAEANKWAEMFNLEQLAIANAKNEALGRELLATPVTSQADMDAMVAASERAGFNPLTVLRAGGLSAFTTQRGVHAASAFQMMMPQVYQRTPAQVPNIPSMATVAAGALSSGFQAYQQQANMFAAQDFQKEMLGLQLSAYNVRGSTTKASFNVPSIVTSGGARTKAGSGALTGMLGGISTPTVGDTEITNPWGFMKVSPNWRNAEAFENRYGEVGGALIGLGILGNDLYYGVTGTDVSTAIGGLKNPPPSTLIDRITGMSAADRVRFVKDLFGGMNLKPPVDFLGR